MASAHVTVDSLATATQVLLAVLEDARVTEAKYSFGPLTPSRIFDSGMRFEGQANKILDRISEMPGVLVETDEAD